MFNQKFTTFIIEVFIKTLMKKNDIIYNASFMPANFVFVKYVDTKSIRACLKLVQHVFYASFIT